MAASETKRLVTANRLRDGVPVYFAGPGCWSTSIEQAALVSEAGGDALLAIAPYLIEAEFAGGHVQPLSLRERIRAFGPTI